MNHPPVRTLALIGFAYAGMVAYAETLDALGARLTEGAEVVDMMDGGTPQERGAFRDMQGSLGSCLGDVNRILKLRESIAEHREELAQAKADLEAAQGDDADVYQYQSRISSIERSMERVGRDERQKAESFDGRYERICEEVADQVFALANSPTAVTLRVEAYAPEFEEAANTAKAAHAGFRDIRERSAFLRTDDKETFSKMRQRMAACAVASGAVVNGYDNLASQDNTIRTFNADQGMRGDMRNRHHLALEMPDRIAKWNGNRERCQDSFEDFTATIEAIEAANKARQEERKRQLEEELWED